MGNGNRKRTKDQYDYENAFDKPLEELDRLFVEEMMKNKVGLHYATKTIKSGKILEVEIYPVFKSKIDIPHVKLDNRKAQNNLNEKNSRKRFIRLVNTNFGEGDFWLTLTYAEASYPKSEKEAKKNITNYLKRVNRLRKKKGLKNAKYIYIIEWEDGPEGKRCHYHLIMEGGIDRDTLENMWHCAVINDSSRIHPNEDGITGLACYMAFKKRKKGERHWTPSKNLKQPKESVSHSKTRKRQVEKMIRDYEEIRAFFEKEKQWQKYQFVDAEVMYNKFNCAFYIRIKARERSWENGRKKKEDTTDSGGRIVRCRNDFGGEGKPDAGAGRRAGDHHKRNDRSGAGKAGS